MSEPITRDDLDLLDTAIRNTDKICDEWCGAPPCEHSEQKKKLAALRDKLAYLRNCLPASPR